MKQVGTNGHLVRCDRLCTELQELLDCAQLEASRASGSASDGSAADWDRGFAEGVASALALVTGEDRDDIHLASVRRVRARCSLGVERKIRLL